MNMPPLLPRTNSKMSSFEPSPAYAAPSSAMLFPASPQSDHDYRKLLPNYAISQKILKYYWSRVHPIACVVHKPSFDVRWQTFWGTLQAGHEVEVSLQAIIFAVLFSGLMSMSEDLIVHELGGNRSAWVCSLHSAVGSALTRANWIRSIRLEILQAVVIYLVRLLHLKTVVSLSIAQNSTDNYFLRPIIDTTLSSRSFPCAFQFCGCCYSCRRGHGSVRGWNISQLSPSADSCSTAALASARAIGHSHLRSNRPNAPNKDWRIRNAATSKCQ